MIRDRDPVRHARARLGHAASGYLAALEQRQRLASNGSKPGDLEAASRKVSAAQVQLIAATKVHGEAWASEHRQKYQSLIRELEAGDAPVVSGYARRIGGRG